MIAFLQITIAILPVFIFLVVLIVFDSFKLVKLRTVLFAILMGCAVALICYFMNQRLMVLLNIRIETFSRFIAPVIEEIFKAAYLIYLIRSKKVGFMVDGAIYGFAIGAGFAFIENVSYLYALETTNLFVWIIRGFGTAIMHGGTTAIYAIITKTLLDRDSENTILKFIFGLIVAIVLHSIFNQFFFGPVITTLAYLIGLPFLIILVYDKSESALRHWLEVGFDSDASLLEMITSGNILNTKLGIYLQTLKKNFPGEIVVDILCLLRIHIELSIRAKGILLMRDKGFDASVSQDVREKLNELKYLEKSIGKTGKLAIMPFMHTSSRELWQIYMLGG